MTVGTAGSSITSQVGPYMALRPRNLWGGEAIQENARVKGPNLSLPTAGSTPSLCPPRLLIETLQPHG